MSRPVLLAWSGGKDSALALGHLQADPRVRVEALLTTVSEEHERISIHGVRRAILHAQAREARLPLLESPIAAQASNAAYEEAFARALDAARTGNPDLDTIAFGDLHLAEVRAWREHLLARHGWRGLFPLWGEDTAALARRFIAEGYRAIVCCVDNTQLDAAFCGRELDADFSHDLPASCDPCGENGEYHTCVYAGPPLAAPLALERGERVTRDGRFEFIDLEERG